LLRDRRVHAGAAVVVLLLAWQAPWALVVLGFVALAALAVGWSGFMDRPPTAEEFEDWF
jgi:hypothetical protein